MQFFVVFFSSVNLFLVKNKDRVMAQTKYDVKISDKAQADEIVKKVEALQGVKFVNVNIDASIVVTHGDDYDEAGFKAIVGI